MRDGSGIDKRILGDKVNRGLISEAETKVLR